LLRALDAFDVTVGDAPPRLAAVRDRPGDEARWTAAHLDLGGEYVAALVLEGSGLLRLRTWRLGR
jgi:hypothetical protein